jgi:methylase of polypeptide subunit release factors
VVKGNEPLLRLLGLLKDAGYHFTTVTPETHARVLARDPPAHPTLRDIFGWNRPFREHQLDRTILSLLRESGCIAEAGGTLRSLIRVSSLSGELFLHSSFPTSASDSVFFGPDTYRFARFVDAELEKLSPPSWMVEMGAGTGAVGIVAAKRKGAPRLTLVDINPQAVQLATINAESAGVAADVTLGGQVPQGCDLVIANPPYMIDAEGRTYRNGGGLFGGEVALAWTEHVLDVLAPDGTFLLYTGAAMIAGGCPLVDRIAALARKRNAGLYVEEIDPDVFGEELSRPGYQDVDRIAAVGMRIAAASQPT